MRRRGQRVWPWRPPPHPHPTPGSHRRAPQPGSGQVTGAGAGACVRGPRGSGDTQQPFPPNVFLCPHLCSCSSSSRAVPGRCRAFPGRFSYESVSGKMHRSLQVLILRRWESLLKSVTAALLCFGLGGSFLDSGWAPPSVPVARQS